MSRKTFRLQQKRKIGEKFTYYLDLILTFFPRFLSCFFFATFFALFIDILQICGSFADFAD